MPPLWTVKMVYSPNVGEGKFCEVGLRLYGVLRSSLHASNAQATERIRHLADVPQHKTARVSACIGG